MTTTYRNVPQVVEGLLKAKEILEAVGWTKFSEHNQFGYCLRGALRESSDLTRASYTVMVRDVFRAICRRRPYLVAFRPEVTIAGYNDAPERQFQEILQILDDAVEADLFRARRLGEKFVGIPHFVHETGRTRESR